VDWEWNADKNYVILDTNLYSVEIWEVLNPVDIFFAAHQRSWMRCLRQVVPDSCPTRTFELTCHASIDN
jgi:hypothetical protein